MHVLNAMLAACIASSPLVALAQAAPPDERNGRTTITPQTPDQALNERQTAIPPITAFTATGDMPRLNAALERGLDAGLTISETKEVLVQMYAYTGFPRSLNALNEFMRVLDAREARGITDLPGAEPGPLPAPGDMLEAGTANQTRLIGRPAAGPLFEFSPQVDRYLKEHLFGAIFARDNLGWQERELATLGALSALPGAESQLQSHMRVSRNVELSESQLRQVVSSLRDNVGDEAADRAEAARTATAEASPPGK